MTRVFAFVCLAACGGRLGASADASTDATTDPGYDDAATVDVLAPDAGADAAFAWPDAALLEACRDAGWIIHVDVDGGYPVDASSATITGDVGTWDCRLNGDDFLQLDAIATSSWAIALASDWQNGKSLAAGTYASTTSPGPYAQVKVADQGCGAIPTGTFTIYALDAPLGENVNVTKFLMSFTLHCTNVGTLSGCARFGG